MNDLLPFRPRPEPGELLTSWLSRLALENGITVSRLIASCVPNTHYRALDLDQHLPRPLLHRLAERTALPWTAIERTSLRELHDLYVGRRHHHGGYRWFMPVHPVRQRFTFYGQQVCPDCLASDAIPYYRQFWRLSFVTTCPVHESLLLDRCPACDAPVDPRRACDERTEIFNEDILCCCGKCGADFRHYAWQALGENVSLQDRRAAWGYGPVTMKERPQRASQEVKLRIITNWQAKLTTDLVVSKVRLGDALIEAESYLRGCRHLLRLISSEPRAEQFSRLTALKSGYPRRPIEEVGRLKFERADIRTRHANLLMLSWLLSDWPISFQELCFESGISHTALMHPASSPLLPIWYERQCLAILAVKNKIK